MPTAGRDRRREQRIENSQRWGTWLTTAMARAHIEPKDLVRQADGAIDKGSVSHWMNGDNTASAEAAVIVAHVLRRDPAEALRAAGHDTLADAIEDPRLARIRASSMSMEEMAVLEAEYRTQIAALDAAIEARLAGHRGDGQSEEAADQASEEAR